MPALRTLMNVALGYRLSPERRESARFRRPDATLSYGAHPLQVLDLYRAGEGTRPLVAFLHGGAWQFGDKARRAADRKADFCHAEGWHFAALNFRMVPEVGVAEMAGDVAKGLAFLVSRSRELEIDRARMVLMGHSSGAHLAALVGTDPRYLAAHALSPDALAGVLAIDGAAYDARVRSTGAAWLERRLVDPAFPPADEVALARLSPALHAAAEPNTPAFLLLHLGSGRSQAQARLIEEALREGGTAVERHAFPGRGVAAHVALSRRFGTERHAPTQAARLWLKDRLA